jgi:hypothetical protein
MTEIFDKLADWVIANDYSGYDPFDGLNSRIFQALPLKHSRFFRLAWIQFFKRSPLNFRKIALVPKGKNPKGLALSVLAWLEIYRLNKSEKAENQIRYLLDKLTNTAIRNPNSALAFGYNFDWQGRAFFAPTGTPTVVPTAFAARAFIESYNTFGDENHLKTARSICDFIIHDLKRTHETADEICFSYSPIDKTRVFNASLLACETLACVGKLTDEIELKNLAVRGANYVVNRQKSDGSWSYGDENYQSWADNFHTAFNLMSLKRIAKACETDNFDDSIRRGYEFWIDNFFENDGFPKYFHNQKFPADCHSSAAAIVCLYEFGNFELAEKIANWTIKNLWNERGYFIYQQKKFYKISIPYMRWTNSWMLYALAKLQNNKPPPDNDRG